MVAPSGDPSDTEAQWAKALKHLNELSMETVQKNTELNKRVAELEEEAFRAAWNKKRASTQKQNEEYDDKTVALKGRIAELEASNRRANQDSSIFYFIDGDSYIFKQSLLTMGQEGGRKAAELLTKGIVEFLSEENIQSQGCLLLWVYVFLNKAQVQQSLRDEGFCNMTHSEAFFFGLSSASPRFLVVDVGPYPDAAANKIRGHLESFVYSPQTLRVILAIPGSTKDKIYTTTVSTLAKEKQTEKLIILTGCKDTTVDLTFKFPGLPSMSINGLFNVTHVQESRPSSGLSRPTSVQTSLLPLSPLRNTAVSWRDIKTPTDKKLVNPDLPLWKNDPPPCNAHYLLSCARGTSCKYSHDYELTSEQLSALASNAKNTPCNFIKAGQLCPYGDKCCWGHICPKGSSCFHYSQGKCWFNQTQHRDGADMALTAAA